MTLEYLKENGLLLFDVISGSRAYGTHKPTSDYDHRGVYILPPSHLYGLRAMDEPELGYIEQVADSTNDCVYYELGRFLELLSQQNPNIIELLNMPEESVVYKHPLFDEILKHKDKFISKVCQYSFGGYAIAQIKKARGLKKKIVNPVAKERKTPLHFCTVVLQDGGGSMPFLKWFKNWHMKNVDFSNPDNFTNEDSPANKESFWVHKTKGCGVSSVPNSRDLHYLFFDINWEGEKPIGYRGIIKDNGEAHNIRMSSIPKGEKPVAIFSYNKDGYSTYCKEYKEYWEWVEKRNEDRYQTNQEHGKNYDSKNMMHCIRLLRMSKEIAMEGVVNVRRSDANELLKIRNGIAEYDTILSEANGMIDELANLYKNSNLPDKVDRKFTNELLINFRNLFYSYQA